MTTAELRPPSGLDALENDSLLNGGDEINTSNDGDGGSINDKKVVLEMLYIDDECYEVDSDSEYSGSRVWLNGLTVTPDDRRDSGDSVDGRRPSTTTPGGFRLLRAYRRRKKRKSTSAVSVVASCSSVEVAEPQTTLMVDDGLDKEPASPSQKTFKPFPEWKKKLGVLGKICKFYGKKLAAFLLSTIGLAVSTVSYAIIGGFLFSALEAPYEVRVKNGVRDSLKLHVQELWNETQKFNVLHPVGHSDTTYIQLVACRLVWS